MKPLSSCALFGAVRTLSGIKDALILQHSVVGCQWGSLAFRYAGKPYDVRQASDVIYDEDVVNGGEKVLRKALQEAERIFAHCGAVFVVSGCVPNMIGDDVDGILATTEGSQKLLHVKAPGYAGNIDSGAEAAYLALLPLLQAAEKKQAATEDHSFYHKKEAEGGKKLIAVELAPPAGIDDEKLMDAAHLLQRSGVDVLTFPDSPSGRTRADSILMAGKVARETGMCVMPHICCRDKNAIAMRSQLLGAYINGIHNFLVITGDPIPSMVRTTVKSVFNFDSVGLMQILADMNEEQFAQAPVSYGGAINQGRRNLEVEIGRVKKKMAAGATFFLTQPISTKESADRVRRIKEETGARILCGIMPFVSLKNATFMKNEMAGIDVTDEVLARYRADMTREEGEQAGVQLAKEVINMTEDFADGYYFSFPFNRVTMLEKILD